MPTSCCLDGVCLHLESRCIEKYYTVALENRLLTCVILVSDMINNTPFHGVAPKILKSSICVN